CSKPRFRDCRVGNSHGLCSDPVRECIALTNITHELGYAARGWRENSEAGRAHAVIRFGVDKVDCLQVRTDSGHDRVTIPNNSPRPRWRGSETQALGSSCEYAGAHRANVYVSEFVAGWRVLGKHSSVHSDPVLQWKRRPVLRHLPQPRHAGVLHRGIGLEAVDHASPPVPPAAGACQSWAILDQSVSRVISSPASSLPTQTPQNSGSSERGCCDLGKSFIFTKTGSSDAHPSRTALCEGSDGSSRSSPLRLSGTS